MGERRSRERGVRAELARKYGVSPGTISRWADVVYDGGWGGLRATQAKGRLPYLTHVQRGKLMEILLRGPAAHGFDSDVWTGQRVAKVIEKEFGVQYSWKYIPQLLNDQLGLPLPLV